MKVYEKENPELKLKRADGTFKAAKILSSKNAAAYFKELFDEEELEIQESMYAIFLNRANHTVGWFRASQGGITGTVVDPRLIFKKALDVYATGLIVCHNHPSGNLYPSQQDHIITKKLKEGGEILDIGLKDHIILTADGYYSFADEGQI